MALWHNRIWADERGMVTVEAAYAIAAMVAVVMLGIGAIVGVTVQIRCTDAAREAARLTAAGDAHAREAATRVVGGGAQIVITESGDDVVVEVRSGLPLLTGIAISAHAVAAKEPESAAESS